MQVKEGRYRRMEGERKKEGGKGDEGRKEGRKQGIKEGRNDGGKIKEETKEDEGEVEGGKEGVGELFKSIILTELALALLVYVLLNSFFLY